MVTVIGFALRQSNEGKEFVSLQLQGELEMVQSLNSGKFYATARRCSISSTFDEATAKQLIGSKYPGSIVRIQCEEYDYKLPETGQILKLAHCYQYSPEEHEAQSESRLPFKKVVIPA